MTRAVLSLSLNKSAYLHRLADIDSHSLSITLTLSQQICLSPLAGAIELDPVLSASHSLSTNLPISTCAAITTLRMQVTSHSLSTNLPISTVDGQRLDADQQRLSLSLNKSAYLHPAGVRA